MKYLLGLTLLTFGFISHSAQADTIHLDPLDDRQTLEINGPVTVIELQEDTISSGTFPTLEAFYQEISRKDETQQPRLKRVRTMPQIKGPATILLGDKVTLTAELPNGTLRNLTFESLTAFREVLSRNRPFRIQKHRTGWNAGPEFLSGSEWRINFDELYRILDLESEVKREPVDPSATIREVTVKVLGVSSGSKGVDVTLSLRIHRSGLFGYEHHSGRQVIRHFKSFDEFKKTLGGTYPFSALVAQVEPHKTTGLASVACRNGVIAPPIRRR